MKVVAEFDFNGGSNLVKTKYAKELMELYAALASVDASTYLTKESKEKTMLGQMLYSPVGINNALKAFLNPLGWHNYKVECEYNHGVFLPDYQASSAKTHTKPFRDMDFVKANTKLGVEVQFGKYAFMVYNVCAKMTIFRNLDVIEAGIEIVPVKNFADRMSTGVSYFEQFAWDLTHRGVSNIDTPVLILGIDA